ncbi:MAG: response regulator [Planctomycetota bacterium]
MAEHGEKRREPTAARRTWGIVDDDPSVLRALSRLLRSADYEVITFVSAEDFLERRDELSVDGLILDLQLPGLGGLELLERLDADGSAIPVLLITAFDAPSVRDRAGAAGVRAFLRKPIAGLELLEAIEDVLS